ncbi:MAG: HEAT repeat domain-containing protein [Melioribacteraceae bacterium]|nr:HEAT repeat domain-containing protein [Melioribacteraceae bacterium]MCF8262922.1 HEAT repeat domain-containing protein [Melioribacteraceae bacterium]MCF8431087.1 HEAT repeat domain-containing protein [Melioribacteraceae bacterium]
MNNERLNELIYLQLFDEISLEESKELESYMLESEDHVNEVEKMKKMFGIIRSNKPEINSADLLVHARNDLMREVRNNLIAVEKINPIFALWESITGGYKVALSSSFTLVLGLFIGYVLFSSGQNYLPTGLPQVVDVDNYKKEEFKIQNVRFLNQNSESGDVEIMFDAVKPVNYKGNINDFKTQRLLASALFDGGNAGFKIKTINQIAQQTIYGKSYTVDEKIRSAIIHSLKNDDNPGVRKQAIDVLIRFPADEKIKEALLYALSNDNNSGIRVAAINALSDYAQKSKIIDNQTKQILNNKMQSDDNEFIRIRAASLLKGVE